MATALAPDVRLSPPLLVATVAETLMRAMRKRGLDVNDTQFLNSPQGSMLIESWARQISEIAFFQQDVYPLRVNYCARRRYRIAKGGFDYVSQFDKRLIEKFAVHCVKPPHGIVNRKAVLLPPDDVSTTAIQAKMARLCLRPALDAELLAFAKAYRKLWEAFPVIGLGTQWEATGGRRFVIGLSYWHSWHRLDMHDLNSRWNERCRFLAILPTAGELPP